MKKLSQKGAIDVLTGLAVVAVLIVAAFVVSRVVLDDEGDNLNVVVSSQESVADIDSFQDCMDWVQPWELDGQEVVCSAADGTEYRADCAEVEGVNCPVVETSALTSEAASSMDIEIASLGLTFSSNLDSDIVITEARAGESVYLSTQKFVDLARSTDEYNPDISPCELQIAAVSVYDDRSDLKSTILPALYNQYFDSNDEYVGQGNAVIMLSDGRYVVSEKQSQALCYDTVHLMEADLILAQLDDLRPL